MIIMKIYHDNVRKVPDLTQLEALDAVASKRSFTLAAKYLNLTQSAVSHQIRRLEDELGFKIFDRNAHEVSLTPAGRDVHEKIRPVLKRVAFNSPHNLRL